MSIDKQRKMNSHQVKVKVSAQLLHQTRPHLYTFAAVFISKLFIPVFVIITSSEFIFMYKHFTVITLFSTSNFIYLFI